MKTILRKPQPPPFPLRLAGMIESGLVFLFAIAQLMAGSGDDAGAWRFVAVASFYAAFRLALRGGDSGGYAAASSRRRPTLH